jgi:hypothetical protein
MDKPQKKLEFGQSPFDHMSREELLVQCQRMYSATVSLVSITEMHRHLDKGSIYWTIGSGAKALEKGLQALTAAQQGWDDEQIHRAFFQYANNILFEDKPNLQVGNGMVICASCGFSVGLGSDEPLPVGRQCQEFRPSGECDGTLRKIEWSDLKPVQSVKAGA